MKQKLGLFVFHLYSGRILGSSAWKFRLVANGCATPSLLFSVAFLFIIRGKGVILNCLISRQAVLSGVTCCEAIIRLYLSAGLN